MQNTNVQKTDSWFVDFKSYAWYLLGLMAVMVFVPTLSKLGVTGKNNLTGLQMTFWVNLFGSVTIIPLYFIVKKREGIEKIKSLKAIDYMKMGAFGLIWPLAYSLCYFYAIATGSAAVTAMITRFVNLFYLPLGVYVFKNTAKLNPQALAILGITVSGVLIASVEDLRMANSSTVSAMAFALLATFMTAVWFNINDIWREKYSGMLMVAIAMIVTACASFVLMTITNQAYLPGHIVNLAAPAVIGMFSNALGFWWLAEGMGIAQGLREKNPTHEILFLIGRGEIVFFGQIFALAVLGVESISTTKWIGTIILLMGLLWYGYVSRNNLKNK
jgi:drug/metabolite transporter (DMT)-like permease